MSPKQLRDTIAAQCGFKNDQQGELPTSFSAWLASNNDSIEMPLDRTEATTQWFDELGKDSE